MSSQTRECPSKCCEGQNMRKQIFRQAIINRWAMQWREKVKAKYRNRKKQRTNLISFSLAHVCRCVWEVSFQLKSAGAMPNVASTERNRPKRVLLKCGTLIANVSDQDWHMYLFVRNCADPPDVEVFPSTWSRRWCFSYPWAKYHFVSPFCLSQARAYRALIFLRNLEPRKIVFKTEHPQGTFRSLVGPQQSRTVLR